MHVDEFDRITRELQLVIPGPKPLLLSPVFDVDIPTDQLQVLIAAGIIAWG